MKRVKMILNCVMSIIKKNFFNLQKTDIYQECERALDFNEKVEQEVEEHQTEEYLKNYNVTTRWQTV